MAEQTEPRMGYKYGWNLGESEFKTGMDANLVKMGALYALEVISATTINPPASPSEGDLYIVPATGATGVWAAQAMDVAYYINGGFRYYTPNKGWMASISDEDSAYLIFDGTEWNTTITLGGDGRTIRLGDSVGTIIGVDESDMFAFHGNTPVIQASSASQTESVVTNADGDVSGLTISAAYDQAEITALRDQCEIVADDMRENNVLLNEIRNVLVELGLMKGSA